MLFETYKKAEEANEAIELFKEVHDKLGEALNDNFPASELLIDFAPTNAERKSRIYIPKKHARIVLFGIRELITKHHNKAVKEFKEL